MRTPFMYGKTRRREIFIQLGALPAPFPEKLNEYFSQTTRVLDVVSSQSRGFRTAGGRGASVPAPARGTAENRKAEAPADNVRDDPRVVDGRPGLTKVEVVIRPDAMAAPLWGATNFLCAP